MICLRDNTSSLFTPYEKRYHSKKPFKNTITENYCSSIQLLSSIVHAVFAYFYVIIIYFVLQLAECGQFFFVFNSPDRLSFERKFTKRVNLMAKVFKTIYFIQLVGALWATTTSTFQIFSFSFAGLVFSMKIKSMRTFITLLSWVLYS